MKKILVIKHGALGDVILAMAPIAAIRNRHKNSFIIVMTEQKYKDFFLSSKLVDEVKIDNRYNLLSPIKLFKIINWIRNNSFQWVYDLQTSSRTNLYYSFISKKKKPFWSGIARGCSHNHNSPSRVNMHTINRHKEQLKIAGISVIKDFKWDWFSADISNFQIPNKYALLFPGGSIKRLEKRWSEEKFSKIAKSILQKNITPVLLGTKEEKGILINISNTSEKIINLAGQTSLAQVAELSRHCIFILGNDTGPMHLVTKCGKSDAIKVVLFGNDSDPKLCSPIGPNVQIIKGSSMDKISLEEVSRALVL